MKPTMKPHEIVRMFYLEEELYVDELIAKFDAYELIGLHDLGMKAKAQIFSMMEYDDDPELDVDYNNLSYNLIVVSDAIDILGQRHFEEGEVIDVVEFSLN